MDGGVIVVRDRFGVETVEDHDSGGSLGCWVETVEVEAVVLGSEGVIRGRQMNEHNIDTWNGHVMLRITVGSNRRVLCHFNINGNLNPAWQPNA